MDQTVSLIQEAPKTKGEIDFVIFEVKSKSDLTAALTWYQERPGNKDHKPARLALANPACGLVVDGVTVDVIRVGYVQPTLIYLTADVDAKGWGKL